MQEDGEATASGTFYPGPAPTPTLYKQPNVWVHRGLWIAGAVVIIVAIPVAYKSMPAFYTLFAVGVALIVAGAIDWGVTNSKANNSKRKREAQKHAAGCNQHSNNNNTAAGPGTVLAAMPTAVRNGARSSIPPPSLPLSPSLAPAAFASPVPVAYPLPGPPRAQAPGSASPHLPVPAALPQPPPLPQTLLTSTPTPPPPPTPPLQPLSPTPTATPSPRTPRDKRRVVWMDDNQPSGSPLARSKDFHSDEPVIGLHTEQEVLVPDHPPKHVPALLPAQRLALGYQSAASPPLQGVPPNNFHQVNPYYTPPQNRYPTVDEIAQERQRFQGRTQTPETERARRLSGVLEATTMLKPDFMSVPVLPASMVM